MKTLIIFINSSNGRPANARRQAKVLRYKDDEIGPYPLRTHSEAWDSRQSTLDATHTDKCICAGNIHIGKVLILLGRLRKLGKGGEHDLRLKK